MSAVKDEMIRVIQEQPEDSAYDEIMRELAFRRMVDRGLSDARAGRTISNDEMAGRIASLTSIAMREGCDLASCITDPSADAT